MHACEIFLHICAQYTCPFPSVISFYVSAGLASLHSNMTTATAFTYRDTAGAPLGVHDVSAECCCVFHPLFPGTNRHLCGASAFLHRPRLSAFVFLSKVICSAARCSLSPSLTLSALTDTWFSEYCPWEPQRICL